VLQKAADDAHDLNILAQARHAGRRQQKPRTIKSDFHAALPAA